MKPIDTAAKPSGHVVLIHPFFIMEKTKYIYNNHALQHYNLNFIQQIKLFLDLFRNACNRGGKERDTHSSTSAVMMNNNILIDSARPKVLPGEESERSSEDGACPSQKYKHNFGELLFILTFYFIFNLPIKSVLITN